MGGDCASNAATGPGIRWVLSIPLLVFVLLLVTDAARVQAVGLCTGVLHWGTYRVLAELYTSSHKAFEVDDTREERVLPVIYQVLSLFQMLGSLLIVGVQAYLTAVGLPTSEIPNILPPSPASVR